MGPLIGLILNLALSFASMPNVYCLCINEAAWFVLLQANAQPLVLL